MPPPIDTKHLREREGKKTNLHTSNWERRIKENCWQDEGIQLPSSFSFCLSLLPSLPHALLPHLHDANPLGPHTFQSYVSSIYIPTLPSPPNTAHTIIIRSPILLHVASPTHKAFSLDEREHHGHDRPHAVLRLGEDEGAGGVEHLGWVGWIDIYRWKEMSVVSPDPPAGAGAFPTVCVH